MVAVEFICGTWETCYYLIPSARQLGRWPCVARRKVSIGASSLQIRFKMQMKRRKSWRQAPIRIPLV